MEIKDILEKVKNQEIDINEALDLLQHQEDYACIDYDRQKRTGVPEIIYGAGKTKEQIAGIISQMLKHNQQNILATKVNLEKYDYLVIGTLESYINIRDYFGESKVVPIYIDLEDGERLMRAIKREKKQVLPQYEELCRRFLADAKDFSKENLDKAGITRYFDNHNLKDCLNEISDYIIAQSHSKMEIYNETNGF